MGSSHSQPMQWNRQIQETKTIHDIATFLPDAKGINARQLHHRFNITYASSDIFEFFRLHFSGFILDEYLKSVVSFVRPWKREGYAYLAPDEPLRSFAMGLPDIVSFYAKETKTSEGNPDIERTLYWHSKLKTIYPSKKVQNDVKEIMTSTEMHDPVVFAMDKQTMQLFLLSGQRKLVAAYMLFVDRISRVQDVSETDMRDHLGQTNQRYLKQYHGYNRFPYAIIDIDSSEIGRLQWRQNPRFARDIRVFENGVNLGKSILKYMPGREVRQEGGSLTVVKKWE